MALGFAGQLLYKKLLKKIPRAAQRLGKAWGRTTDRYLALRVMNTCFYLAGMVATLTGSALAINDFIKPATPTFVQMIPTPVVQTEVDDILSPEEILRLVNLERQALGIAELTADPALTAVAEERAEDMVLNQYYAHQSPDGTFYSDLFAQHDFSAGYSCENLNIEFTLDERQYIDDWLNSDKGHKECLLNDRVTKAGYAVGVFNDPDKDGSTVRSYIVVAIHAAPPFSQGNASE